MTQEGIEIEPLDWSQAESTDASAMPQLQPPAAKPPRASKGGRNSRNTRNKPEGALDAARVALAASDIDQAADLYSQLIARGKMLDDIIDDLDAALSADRNFLLGNWIADAASWGGADPEWTSLLVFNARNQITLWGPHGEIND